MPGNDIILGMSENSFVGAAGLVMRPFFEELEGNWKIIQGIAVASLIVAICMWFFTLIASSTNFERALFVLTATGWFALIIFLVCYGTIYWELHMRDKDMEDEKHKKVKAFTDVDKR